MSSVPTLNDRVEPFVVMKDESASRRFNWPQDMPEQCPPEEAHCGDGETFFRFVKRDKKAPPDSPVTAADFARPRDSPRKEPIPDGQLCQHSALSIIKDIEDVKKMRDLIPAFKKEKKRLAAGRIMGGTG